MVLRALPDHAFQPLDQRLGKIKDVSAGGRHTCGVRSDDAIVCWGSNAAGQSSPPAGRFKRVSAGDEHTCGIRVDDLVECWGDNTHGQSGAVDQTGAPVHPVQTPFIVDGTGCTDLTTGGAHA